VAADSTVLGDFDDASFTQHGITHRFFQRDGGWWVETEGPDGGMTAFEVTHVIGVEPLQQYLTPFPGGRLQTLPTSWDTRPAEEGGQRWFHIYGDERIAPDDPLFWTGINQNWNFQCAECHSTDLRKNYRMGGRSFDTTFEEIDVSCEACHGPASIHVERARAAEGAGEAYTAPDGGDLQVALGAETEGIWTWDGAAGRPVRSAPTGSSDQIATCARCHARRGLETTDYAFGEDFLSTHRPALPRSPLYYHDGQILDEVYVYGSFVQSRMYQEGVLCSDCHEPHSNDLLAPGPDVCARCHAPAVYVTADHDFHPRPEGGAGADDAEGAAADGGTAVPVTVDPATWRNPEAPTCLDCHMQERSYMVVDPRGDHSFRIPRPDQSPLTGAPNACTACHVDQSDVWAADAVAEWYGPEGRQEEAHYGAALANAARGGPSWPQGLTAVIDDPSLPGIVRASALEALAGAHPRHLLARIEGLVEDPDPFVRRTVAEVAAVLVPEDRVRALSPLLNDPVLGVRAAAARTLAGPAEGSLPADLLIPFETAEQEWVQAQFSMAEAPTTHVNLGTYYAVKGRGPEAESSLRLALEMDSSLVSAWANLADLFRAMGREADAEATLESGIARVAQPAPLIHSRGLLRVRQGRIPEALPDLERSVELDPDSPRYSYVLTVAMLDTEGPDRALEVLSEALGRTPNDRDLLSLGFSINLDLGRTGEARGYAERLAELDPGDPDAQAALLQVGGQP
jgi:tetratricopeptide (TPR) repeat protein